MKKKQNKYEGLVGKLISRKRQATAKNERNDRPLKDAVSGIINSGSDYEITPRGLIMLSAIESFDLNEKVKDLTSFASKVNEFEKKLLQGLSRIATGNKTDDMFGYDFNEFFALYVQAMNMCGKMRKLLEDNGIPFDLNDDLNNGDSKK